MVRFEDAGDSIRAFVVGGAGVLEAVGPGRDVALRLLIERNPGWFGISLEEWPTAPLANRLIPQPSPAIVDGSCLNLEFRTYGAFSPFDALVKQLGASPAGAVLKIPSASEALEAALAARGRRLNIRLVFALQNGFLYARVDRQRRRSVGKRSTAALILKNLVDGPASIDELHRATGRSAQAIGRTLDRLRVRNRITWEHGRAALAEEVNA
jgi:hypothetical protein